MKIIFSAYACEPGKGSEPGVGWMWAKEVSRFAEVWVITRANNREPIEKELQKQPVSNIHFVYTDWPPWLIFWKKKNRGVSLYHYLWQISTFFLARKLHKVHAFDIAQHLTFGTAFSPSLICLLPIPFIWGPIAAINPIPGKLRPELGLRGRIYRFIREFTHSLRFNLDPLVRMTWKRSNIILCKTTDTCSFLRNMCPNKKVILMTANGAPQLSITGEKLPRTNGKMKVFSAGRLVSWKGFSLAIKAFAQFHQKHEDSTFDIVGEGPELLRLRRIARYCGLSDVIRLHGHMTREDTLGKMAASDVFLFPSMLDAAASVIMEAMLLRKPVICLDHSGPGDVVTDRCGIKIKPQNPQSTINKLAAALERLAANPELREKMGEAGKQRVNEDYGWDARRNVIREIYNSVL